jgi:ketosteroid isomerase-like protein
MNDALRTVHPHVALARSGYNAFARGDLDEVLRLLAPEIVWHVGGAGPLSGAHRGPAGVAILLGKVFELTAGSQRLEIREIFATDEHVIAVVHETATRARDGATLDVREAHLLRMDTDGKVAEFWDVPDDADAHDEFFG